MYRRTVIIGIICCLLISVAGIAVAGSESLRATNAVDTPEETFQGHTVTHIGVFEQGDLIEATITGEDTYNIGLFDDPGAGEPVAYKTEVDGTFSFDSNNLALEPGSYYLQVNNTFFEEISPIVISGYDVAVDLTEETADDELTIEATVTETALQGAPHKVEAVVWNEDRDTRTELTADGEFSSSGEYESTISIDDFDGEPYNVYVVAVSENEIEGENEILAIGEASGGDQDDDPDDSNGTDNGSDDTDDGSDDSDETDADDDNTDEVDDTDEPNDEQNESDPDADDDEADDDPSVIEPNTSAGGDDTTGTDDSTQADDDSIDEIDDETPLSVVLPVVALLFASLGIARLK